VHGFWLDVRGDVAELERNLPRTELELSDLADQPEVLVVDGDVDRFALFCGALGLFGWTGALSVRLWLRAGTAAEQAGAGDQSGTRERGGATKAKVHAGPGSGRQKLRSLEERNVRETFEGRPGLHALYA
jgi:hypothetical protein